MEYRIELESWSAGIDYLAFKVKDVEQEAIAWETWNRWENRCSRSGHQVKSKPTSSGQLMTCLSMGVRFSSMELSSLWATGEALSWLLKQPDIERLSATRVDIQVSGHLSESSKSLARELRDFWSRPGAGNAGRSKRTLIESDTGSTLYLGSRSSPRFLRVYDKGGEQGSHELGELWRFELEFKGYMAAPVFQKAIASESVEGFSAANVVGYLRARSVHLCCDVDRKSEIGIIRPSTPTDESSLLWLTESVSPVVKRLMRNGRKTDLEKVFGFKIGRE